MRLYDSLQSVAPHTVKHISFLLLCAGNAQDPFRICKLGGEILCLAEFQIGSSLLLRSNFHGSGSVEIVSNSPDTQGILARFQFVGREAVAALLIANHRYR